MSLIKDIQGSFRLTILACDGNTGYTCKKIEKRRKNGINVIKRINLSKPFNKQLIRLIAIENRFLLGDLRTTDKYTASKNNLPSLI